MPASGPRSRAARAPARPCQGSRPWRRPSAVSGLVLATQNLGGIPRQGTSWFTGRDMQTQVEELAEGKVRLDVDVPTADVQHAIDHAASDLAGNLKIPGFR